jgi:dimethylglycine dehydrogenase
VGAGIAYHLAKRGWDTLLLERDELTSGSTWHAAGLLPLFNMSYATSHIHDYSVKFYKTLEAETGLNAGFFVVGNLRMAQSRARMDEYMLYASTAETVGIPYEWLSPAEIRARWPLVRTEDLKARSITPRMATSIPPMSPGDGQGRAAVRGDDDRTPLAGRCLSLDRVGMARDRTQDGGTGRQPGPRRRGGRDHRRTCGHRHRQPRPAHRAAVGIKIPAIPVEHQYIVTEPDPALVDWRKAGNPEHPVLRDADAKWYVREERGGWILGPYERGAPARFEYDVPETFRADLFPLDLDRIEEEYMSMIHRIPSSETVGLKDDYNGPICYTPDGNPLLGPAPGLRNMWLAEGFSFGITAAGGTGHYLAQLMADGEAEIDMGSLDPRRYGAWMTTEYAARKNEEAYEHVYILHHPDEERPACRPLRTAPCYDRHEGARRAVRPGQWLGTAELFRAARCARQFRP